MTLKRVAIYGGTFDPVHNGHIEVARAVLTFFELEELWFVPAWAPPHKRNLKLTSAFHRFGMLSLATQTDQRLLISTVELDSPDRPYAVDTITRMLKSDQRLFFLIGADSWNEITTWFEWQKLLTLCDLIVVTRPGYEIAVAPAAAKVVDLRGLRDNAAIDDRRQSEEYAPPRVFITDVANVDLSATTVRSLARAGDLEGLKTVMPPGVADYIGKHRLYKTE
ncbi:MAG TPA: nicotinate-nucleotide adenylyltransferase [Pyrinomonadaceae bacterium]|jgi:nicotinate-nucleotide adenylyltransferase|nr:nicotinate-nucleotide adenylyltransferase [Pyrinomonadaceae bacterium]